MEIIADINGKYFLLIKEDVKPIHDKNFWHYVSMSPDLPVEFIREFKDKLDWNKICWTQNLSENSIEEFKIELSWYSILKNQNFSKKFMSKYFRKLLKMSLRKKMDFYYALDCNSKISKETKSYFKDLIYKNVYPDS